MAWIQIATGSNGSGSRGSEISLWTSCGSVVKMPVFRIFFFVFVERELRMDKNNK